MAGTSPSPPPTPNRLRSYLQAYWLRPENAFWMTIRSDTLAHCPLNPPVLDISCGDGIFSFLHAGGVFDPDFDVFAGLTTGESAPGGRRDMFDCCPEDYRPTITSPPRYSIEAGCDWKNALLDKARHLNLYRRLVRHDNNQPLPFEDETFQTVYCNAAYWVADIDPFLREVRRVTRRDGHVVLQVKLDCLRRYTLEAHRAVLGDRVLDIIGRGRIDSWPTLADQTTWERRFASAGLRVLDAAPFITRTHAHVWDVGLRPIAPLLVRMTGALNSTTRAAIKRDWVDLFVELLTPLCRPDLELFPGHDEPGEIQYVLNPARSSF